MSFFILAGKGARRPSTLHWLATFGAPGVFGMSLVDASIIPLAIPGSTDLLLLWLISRGGNPYVLVGCAVAGSIIGGWTTWRVGKKGGDAAIGRYASLHLQKRVRG